MRKQTAAAAAVTAACNIELMWTADVKRLHQITKAFSEVRYFSGISEISKFKDLERLASSKPDDHSKNQHQSYKDTV